SGSASFGGLNEAGGWEPGVPVMRAAYREGLGCMTLAPDQTLEAIDELPELTLGPASGDPSQIPWPDGDLVPEEPLPDYIDQAALEAAGKWAFDRVGHGGHESQITLSFMVVHKGDIVYERYGPGVDMTTRTRTWSTAKSIASTLIGIAVDEGILDLDEPLPFDHWEPERRATGLADPRREITLRQALNMSSGLYPVDNRLCSIIGSCLSYFAGTSSAEGAIDRGVVAEPGTVWDYENYDTLLGVLALKTALADEQTYLEFPRVALFDKIGMRSTLPGVDRFGDYVMSSQVYTNARDLARLGLLYLNEGVWDGERLLSREWIDFVRTPAPATADIGNFYGGQFWLPNDRRTDVPQDAYTTAGNRGQYATIVPSYDLVIVRRGLDWQPSPGTGFSWEDMVVEVIKAFPAPASAEKFMAGGR
ncbi:MAG: beta-lactamase family protein, partial [Gemmatimonadetes bacterium]|nr:beta-lactamase family protein [Gemmatimonadota bacterium]